MHLEAVPEDEVAVPDGRDDLLDNVLAEEALGVGDGGDFEGVEALEGRGRVDLLGLAVEARGELGEGAEELVALHAAARWVAATTSIRGPDASDEGRGLASLLVVVVILMALVLVALWVRNFVQTVFHGLSLR